MRMARHVGQLGYDRALHMRTVSALMGALAPLLGLDEGEAALVGWLHDFGCCLGAPSMDERVHARRTGALLRGMGFAYWREIALHGTSEGLDTPMGVLLNVADMAVDPRGRVVGFDRRLAGIASRYGVGSDRYRDAVRLVEDMCDTDEWLAVCDAVSGIDDDDGR